MSINSQIKQWEKNMKLSIKKLQRKKKELPLSAFEAKKTECLQCSFCCWAKPCKFSKGDVEILSKAWLMTPEEFFKKYLIIDIDNHEGRMCITPIRKNKRRYAGTLITQKDSFNVDAPCIFLTEKKCTLEKWKPEGAKRYECWNAPVNVGASKELFKDLYWSKEEIERYFKVRVEVIGE